MADYEGSHEYEGMKKSMEALSKEVERLPKEMELYGRVCAATVDRTNALVIDAYEGIRSFDALMEFMEGENDAVRNENDAELEYEGFTREDVENGSVPAYIEDRLHAEHDPGYYLVAAGNAFEDLHETAYKADFVLTDETKKILGPEYELYVREMHEQEAKEQTEVLSEKQNETHGERRLPDIPGNVICDPETGIMHSSLTDVYGNPVDDDFAFDELD